MLDDNTSASPSPAPGAAPAPAPAPVAKGLQGVVRRYNGSKGFGFIEGPGAYGDVMFSRHELPEDARELRGQILEQRNVVFDGQIQPDGRAKATSVTIPYVEGQKTPGIIRSFGAKGYGFVRSSCLTDDVYFRISDFQPPQNLAFGVSLQGALVLLEVEKQPDGKLKASKIQFQTAKIAEKYTMGRSAMDAAMGFALTSMRGKWGTAGTLCGVVKSFNEARGYGFINIPGLPVDFRFGRRDLGNRTVTAGSTVQFTPTTGADGRLLASQVAPAPPGEGGDRGAGAAALWSPEVKTRKADVPVTPTGQWLKGVVKSYNPLNGWGLIETPGIPAGGAGQGGDVFFMKSNLPQELRNANIQGRSVSFELMTTADGKYRAQNITKV